MPTFAEPALAKVNLFLHVGARRRDRYHDLTSLVVFPEVGDTITVIPAKARQGREPGPIAKRAQAAKILRADEWVPGLARRALARDDDEGGGQEVIGLAIKGPFAKELAGEGPPPSLREYSPQHAGGRFRQGKSSPTSVGEVPRSGEGGNLVLRAAQALAHGRIVPPTKITLTKNLPIASGIGGGSADAAAALRILNEVWGLRLTKDELRAIGLTLGSDVPVCVDPVPQWMEGRGQRVERGPRLPEIYLTLVNPGVPVPTGPVFQALTKKSGAKRPVAPKSFASARSLSAWLARETRNDLQAPAIQIAPPVADVLTRLEALEGCLLARMSGSGATCFGLFATEREAARAAAAMPKPWWTKAAGV